MKKSILSLLTAGLLVLTPTAALATTDQAPVQCEDTSTLTILATTDLHGTVLNYDYFTGGTFTDDRADQRNRTRGLELLAPAIEQIRAEKGADSVALFDNGDANQGNPLETVYHANRTADTTDPMASAFNYLDYDAGVVGNHEFNYGITATELLPGDLQQYESNLDMPLLGANVIDRASGEPFLDPYTMINKTVDGQEVTIGVVGVVTPGIRIWDAAKVTALDFQDTVEAVRQWVPVVKEQGADVVVVLAHTGMDAPDYTWNPGDLNENLLTSVATLTEGVDVIIGGHSHALNNFDTTLTNAAGEQVLVSQPGYHARFLSEVEVPLVFTEAGPEVVNTADCRPTGTPHYASDYIGQEDAGLRAAIEPWHTKTVEWTETVVAYATEDMPAATAPWEDTPIVDFISLVETQAVEAGLEGTEYADIPVIAQASPFSRSAIFPQGDVTIADMAGLYTYDNTLKGVQLTGAQVKDYLEWSARYYKQQDEGAIIEDWSTVTNEVYSGRAIPDYAYDVLSGVNYHINISKPVGERIENLSHPDGTPVAEDDLFIMAINDYRQGGGQAFPHVADAPIVFDELQSIRDLMITWAQENQTIDPNEIFTLNWTVGTSTAPAPGLPGDDETSEPTDPAPTEPVDPEPTEPAPTEPEPTDPEPAPVCQVMDKPVRLAGATGRFGEATGDTYADVWAVNGDGQGLLRVWLTVFLLVFRPRLIRLVP